jgi:hypothetical protein
VSEETVSSSADTLNGGVKNAEFAAARTTEVSTAKNLFDFIRITLP